MRRRADYVFKTYVKQACDGTDYRAVRGDGMTGQNIMGDVSESLQTAPMVVAYLGGADPNWNPNVMLEIGFRLATGLPIIFLRESVSEGAAEIPVPFDLKDQRQVNLPPEEPDERRSPENRNATKITTIRKMLVEAGMSGWQYPHPCGSITIHLGANAKPNRFIEASSSLEDLFDFRAITGAALQPIIEHLMRKMPKVQRDPFGQEQDRLIKDLISPNVFQDSNLQNVVATIPIVFEEHRKFRGRAFLPIIGSYAKFGDVLKLKIVYLDVTSVTQQAQDGHFVCCLREGKPLVIARELTS